jgi:hypothetical protein
MATDDAEKNPDPADQPELGPPPRPAGADDRELNKWLADVYQTVKAIKADTKALRDESALTKAAVDRAETAVGEVKAVVNAVKARVDLIPTGPAAPSNLPTTANTPEEAVALVAAWTKEVTVHRGKAAAAEPDATGTRRDKLRESIKECDRMLRSLGRNTLETFKALAQAGTLKEVAEDLASEAKQAVDNAKAALATGPGNEPRPGLPRTAATPSEAEALAKAWSGVVREAREAVANEAANAPREQQPELNRIAKNCKDQIDVLKKFAADAAVLPAALIAQRAEQVVKDSVWLVTNAYAAIGKTPPAL